MIIKHQLSFKLRPYGSEKTAQQIQLHATFSALRLVVSTGCQLTSAKAWDPTEQRVVSGYKGGKGETALSINEKLRHCKEQMEMVFRYYEATDTIPTKEQVAQKYQERMTGIIPKKPEPVQKRERTPQSPDFYDTFEKFLRSSGEKNAWTPATYEKMEALRVDLKTFQPKLQFDDLTETTLTKFVAFLRDEKKLHTPRKKKGERDSYDSEDITGLKNSTIGKKLGYLRWFLNWATNKGYNKNMAYKTFKPTLKQTQKKVIYLTKEELSKLQSMDLSGPGPNAHLEPVRDVFLFCCFTGLRHSDVYNLKKNDVKEDHLEVTTIKTADTLSIELNKVSLTILEKYKNVDFKNGKALPVIQNQPMNRDLKKLCKLAEINEVYKIVTYKGNLRQEVEKQKWELVGTHTGRRTFIVNALSLGIPPNVVMKWTGHNDYKSMKPYIDIVDSIKAKEMTKLDSLL